MPALAALKTALVGKVREAEDWWFDWSRRVKTGDDGHHRTAQDTVGQKRDGYIYGPARAKNVRAAIAALGIKDYRDYTFVDLGSGKGRPVFLAAELPFRKAIGVEYSQAMHRAATENLRTFRGPAERRERMEFVEADAAEYELPAGNLVLHLFNPFGPEVMVHVLRNLEASLRNEPRHVMVVLLWPTLSEMVAAVPGMRPFLRSRRYDIFETRGAPEA